MPPIVVGQRWQVNDEVWTVTNVANLDGIVTLKGPRGGEHCRYASTLRRWYKLLEPEVPVVF